MDDEDSVRDVAGIMLKHIGYEVGLPKTALKQLSFIKELRNLISPLMLLSWT
jgi:hypothetical protein